MGCLFCKLGTREILCENKLAYAINDKYAVSSGHILVIPKRHIVSCFEMTQSEIVAVYKLITDIKVKLDKRYSPDGYNVGFNSGSSAGQTIMHAHIHVIPRYKNDVPEPRGGIRNIIPTKGAY